VKTKNYGSDLNKKVNGGEVIGLYWDNIILSNINMARGRQYMANPSKKQGGK
jgi:hypothetical protein